MTHPPDTLVDIPGWRSQTIAQAFVHGGPDAGESGADNQDVEMFARLCGGHGAERRGDVHEL